MRAVTILSLLGLSLCVAASAEEATDRACTEAVMSRARTVPGAVVKDLRSRKTPPMIGSSNDDRSFTLEVEITSSSINATYIYICKPNPGREADLELISIR
jgi:hypothetical protein